MGILGLWQKINEFHETDTYANKFSKIYIDAHIMFFRLASPLLSITDKETYKKVFKRNFDAKILFLESLLVPGATISDSLIVVLDSPGSGKNKKRRIEKREDTTSKVIIPAWIFKYFLELIIDERKMKAIMEQGKEADHLLCEIFAGNKKEKGLMAIYTDDSDLLLCAKYIIRHNKKIYNVTKVVKSLGITMKKFNAACSMAANDYNNSNMTFGRALNIIVDGEKSIKKRNK